jgi:hypothetical protein
MSIQNVVIENDGGCRRLGVPPTGIYSAVFGLEQRGEESG